MPSSSDSSFRDVAPRPVAVGHGRVEEAEQRFPSYTPLMLLLSLLYLVLVLAFGARLLDGIGTSLGTGQLQALSAWSQALFGCAVALALWGSVALPWMEGSRLSWRGRWLILVSTGVVAMLLSVATHRALIGWMTDDPTGERARRAVHLNLLAHAALEDHVVVTQPPLQPEMLASPAGKTFLALLLANEMTDPRGAQPGDETVRQVMQALAAQRVGTAAQVYDNIFVPSVRSLKDAYNAYVAAQTALVDDIKAIMDQQTQAWNDYLEGLGKRGLSLAKLTRNDWPAIVTEVRQNGVAVPLDWNPADRTTYVTALSTQQRERADAQYAERLRRLFGAELPPGLEWDQFYANPIVQARWRTAVSAPAGAALSPTMGFRAFDDTVYRPMVEQTIQPRLTAVLAPASAYAPGGAMAALGQMAELRIALPLVALALAMLGTIWHGCGMAAYAARLVLPRWPWRRRALALVLATCGLFVLGARNPVTRSDSFSHLQDQIADRAGPAWLAALGMVEAYGVAQPWGDTLRRTVLSHQEFGLDPFAGARTDHQAALDRLLP